MTGRLPLYRTAPKAQCPGFRSDARNGLTLLEIILAMGIFLGAMAAIGQLMNNGISAATRSRLTTQAVIRCETVLAEFLAGVQAWESATEVPFEDDSNWTWSVSISEGPLTDLLQLDVTVAHTGDSGLSTVSHTLTRYVRDPQIFVDAEAQAAVEEEL